MANEPLDLQLVTVSEKDFESLAAIRVAAMRESLERVGRFDENRARMRLRNSFVAEATRRIVSQGETIGFYAVIPGIEGLRLDHLYILPQHQGKGLGSAVLSIVFAQADQKNQDVVVGALRESASNRFYQRHGFVKSGESEFDTYYIRRPNLPRRAETLSLEPAAEADAELVYRIKFEAYADYAARAYGRWDEEFHRQFTRRNLPYTRLLRVGNETVGSIVVKPLEEHDDIIDLHVLPIHQRKGLGKATVQAVLAEARAKGKSVSLGVLKINPSRTLYERLGFVAADETATHILMTHPNHPNP